MSEPISCDRCDRWFNSIDSFEQHQDENSRHRFCDLCDGRYFQTRGALIQHGMACHGFHCVNCDMFFNKERHFNTHYATFHQPEPKPEKTFHCIGKTCNKRFHSISGVSHHLESGACKSNFNRATVKQIVVRLDAHNVITNPNRLIRGPDGYEAPIPELLYARPSSWNGSYYECFICYCEFRTLRSLDLHLKSPRHEEAIYRCPNKQGCIRDFKTLGALCAHAEKDKCGVQKFNHAKEAVESLMAGLKTLGI